MAKKKKKSEKGIEGEAVTYYVFVRKGRMHFSPQCMAAGAASVRWIFPVPEPNAVGSLDNESNGIVFVKFGGYGVEPACGAVAKDYNEKACGHFNYRFSPNFSDDRVVYSQNRVAVVADVKAGEAFYARCGLSMDDYMPGIRFLDPKDNLFVIVKSIYDGKGKWDDYLHIVRLEGHELIDTNWVMGIGETFDISPDFPLYNTWLVHANKLFVYEGGANSNHGRVLCTDGARSISHPFSEIYNRNFGAGSKHVCQVRDFALHPKQSFGVIIEECAAGSVLQRLTVLRWDTRVEDKQVASYSGEVENLASHFGIKGLSLAYQSFSPCGNWYVVGCISPDEPESPHFISVPVNHPDRDNPYFLDWDNIVVLGQVEGMASLAWTREPSSLVVSNGELLHKWDLDELPNARVFADPGEVGVGKVSFIRRLFGGKG